MKQKIILIVICLLLYGLTPLPAFSQSGQNIFQEKSSLDTLNKALSQLYNFRFSDAQTTVAPLRFKYKENPAILIFDCLTIYWKNFPLSYHPAQDKVYSQTLEDAREKTKQFLKDKPDDPERIFYTLFVNILLAREYAAREHSTKAAGAALEAYKYIKKGFKLKEKFSEFYFSTGLYNYYREFLPEQSSIYKFLAWSFSFPSGSKKNGLFYLDKSTSSTVYVKPESLLITAAIYLKYENDKAKAVVYSEQLNRIYPNNIFFKTFYTETLIQNNRFQEAENELKFIESVKDSSDYLKLSVFLFHGIIAEKYYKDDAEAQKNYISVVKYKPNWDTENYIGLAFFGLGNIAKREGDTNNAKKYYKKANKMCEYQSVKSATKDF